MRGVGGCGGRGLLHRFMKMKSEGAIEKTNFIDRLIAIPTNKFQKFVFIFYLSRYDQFSKKAHFAVFPL
jgi:hypothetical protein